MNEIYENVIFLMIYFISWASITNHLININPFKPEFTIVIFLHYKPRIATAILDL